MCPECRGETRSIVEGSTLVISCEKCNWSIATSYLDPVYEDEADYTLRMGFDAPTTKEALKVVSLLVGKNFIQAKRILNSPGYELFKGKAPEIKEAIEKLSFADVPYEVTPDFPYAL
jgi:hypothetical protein